MWTSHQVTPDTRFYWNRTVISHNRTFISESKQRGHLFSFTRAAQPVLFQVVVMGYCKFSPTSPLKRRAYLPALMMSPLLSSHPSRQWQDKGSLPGEPFWKAQPFSLDSVPIMMDTQRTASHKGFTMAQHTLPLRWSSCLAAANCLMTHNVKLQDEEGHRAYLERSI